MLCNSWLQCIAKEPKIKSCATLVAAHKAKQPVTMVKFETLMGSQLNEPTK